ncbi:LuxR family transcriptional regulator [Streptomyces sp. SCA3-4]|uniref:LuxR family transcriptional regulator n=1 Tax=Streptomyces sichuanensis TaxID=2871810 RepID=UPI001CE387EA|nr:LuxR family transcriptional regulator [Streptomyces sichuanensis]MCA6094693.1 LuxR family transcriptional regulator [Streptomyces sichuanensis]
MSFVLQSAYIGAGSDGIDADGRSHGPLGYPGDEFEQELLEVSALIESTVVKHRGRLHGSSLVSLVKAGGEATDLSCRLIAKATDRVDVVLASEAAYARPVIAATARLLDARQGDLSVRFLCTAPMVDWQFVRRYARERQWIDVRIARIPLLAGVIVDGREALVCADSAVGRRASAIRTAGVVKPLLTLFDGVWRNSVAVTDRIDFGDHARTETARRILEQLRAGATDEVSARELAMSVRTYRRYVAEIMSLVGATSRFQAGVRAAELGLFPAATQQGRS